MSKIHSGYRAYPILWAMLNGIKKPPTLIEQQEARIADPQGHLAEHLDEVNAL